MLNGFKWWYLDEIFYNEQDYYNKVLFNNVKISLKECK